MSERRVVNINVEPEAIRRLGMSLIRDGVSGACKSYEAARAAGDVLIGLTLLMECAYNGQDVDLEALGVLRDELERRMKQVTDQRDRLYEWRESLRCDQCGDVVKEGLYHVEDAEDGEMALCERCCAERRGEGG